jgi:hypothetical protein
MQATLQLKMNVSVHPKESKASLHSLNSMTQYHQSKQRMIMKFTLQWLLGTRSTIDGRKIPSQNTHNEYCLAGHQADIVPYQLYGSHYSSHNLHSQQLLNLTVLRLHLIILNLHIQ